MNDPRAEAARQWVTSPAGRQAMADSQKRAAVTCARYREALRPDPQHLHRPVTPPPVD